MTDIIKNFSEYISIIAVGVVATIVKMIQTPNISQRSIFDKVMIFLTGSITSAFFCWMSFELALYITNNENSSLAIGGFTAWKGGEWVTKIIDKFINIKILGCDECSKKDDE